MSSIQMIVFSRFNLFFFLCVDSY